ncbi:basic proline-rich protein-like [Choloepus didactylus]|uniref:basic proline-rich protein-like n=1 Tax=Choloepus didactylus TaxID=27675 RepID=UPI0018A0FFD4|nr:basic proline-rich protein-like [Choloepus didactylus]
MHLSDPTGLHGTEAAGHPLPPPLDSSPRAGGPFAARALAQFLRLVWRQCPLTLLLSGVTRPGPLLKVRCQSSKAKVREAGRARGHPHGRQGQGSGQKGGRGRGGLRAPASKLNPHGHLPGTRSSPRAQLSCESAPGSGSRRPPSSHLQAMCKEKQLSLHLRTEIPIHKPRRKQQGPAKAPPGFPPSGPFIRGLPAPPTAAATPTHLWEANARAASRTRTLEQPGGRGRRRQVRQRPGPRRRQPAPAPGAAARTCAPPPPPPPPPGGRWPRERPPARQARPGEGAGWESAPEAGGAGAGRWRSPDPPPPRPSTALGGAPLGTGWPAARARSPGAHLRPPSRPAAGPGARGQGAGSGCSPGAAPSARRGRPELRRLRDRGLRGGGVPRPRAAIAVALQRVGARVTAGRRPETRALPCHSLRRHRAGLGDNPSTHPRASYFPFFASLVL